MSKAPVKTPASSLAAFLNALSWTRLRVAKDPDFDAGINTSSAWTESLASPDGIARTSLHGKEPGHSVNVNSLSDDEAEARAVAGDEEDWTFDTERGNSARALYAFEGKPEFRELTAVEAGDRLEVLRDDVGDGWSLVKNLEVEEGHQPEVGLIPRTYYTVSICLCYTLLLLNCFPSLPPNLRRRLILSYRQLTLVLQPGKKLLLRQ